MVGHYPKSWGHDQPLFKGHGDSETPGTDFRPVFFFIWLLLKPFLFVPQPEKDKPLTSYVAHPL